MFYPLCFLPSFDMTGNSKEKKKCYFEKPRFSANNIYTNNSSLTSMQDSQIEERDYYAILGLPRFVYESFRIHA